MKMSDIPTRDELKTTANKSITYNDVATKLLGDRLLLTALELHTELVESGRELKQLKDFFSNPGNFEIQSPTELQPSIARSGSQATLDSLDLTRFSEDGERGVDERVAVLEFELRKAKETINALRANLTVATESETNSPVTGYQKQLNNDTIKPHEQRALNFLINEYLLLHGYKLTSITFADENENQDFEDWDDVGLNISKPAELLALYREGLRQAGHDATNVGCQTDFPNTEEFQNTIKLLNVENDSLKAHVVVLQLENEQLVLKSIEKDGQLAENAIKLNLVNAAIEHDASTNNSSSPDRFEMIEKDLKNRPCLSLEDDGSVKSLNEWTKVTLENRSGFSKSSEQDSSSTKSEKQNDNKNIRELPMNFRKELYSECLINIPTNAENQTLDELLKDDITHESLVHTLSDSLLRIIPNIILNKREEVIPLLVSAVHLNPNCKERDKLLQQLFNLKKRPSEEERRMILAGILRIAKCQWENLVESEILPQCWEQLTHKHVERRLLVAESCSALTPFVTSTIRNSLMLSMLQQMLEDKDESVRVMVIRALALVVACCDDANKYSQCEELAMITLDDTAASVVHHSIRLLFPVLSKWALDLGCLQTNLIKLLLHKFNAHLKDIQAESPTNKLSECNERILQIVTVLNALTPYILMSVTAVDQIFSRIEEEMVIELKPDFAKLCSPLTNPMNFYESHHDVGMILYEFDNYMALENYVSWTELDWMLDIVLPDLLNNVNHIDITQNALLHSVIQLFTNLCVSFGKNFTKYRIKPIFQSHVQNLEQILASFNEYSPNLSIIPVYLISVLSYLDDLDDLLEMLKRFICALPLCGTPLDCLEVIVKGLCDKGLQELVIAALWEGVVHQRSLVRSAAAGLFSSVIRYCGDNLLCTKVAPALVTLANDSDLMVRTATIPALGAVITDCSVQEVHDKAYMQLQSFLSDSNAKDHAIMRSLVVTLAQILNACKATFRDDVILPQLSAMSAYTSQMSNQTRKIDMASALIEAFSTVVYSPLNINRNLITTVIYPGLKYLESIVIENSALHLNKDNVTSMVKEVESRIDYYPQTSVERNMNSLSQNVNQGVEDMKNRMSKIFNKPNITKPTNLPNIQGIFKKK